MEYRLRACDGRDVWVSDSASLLFTEDGSPQCWHGMMIDITERKRAEEELRAAKEAAEEASRLKSTFLSMATHELRTPLTIISGYVELLAESAKTHLTSEEQDYLLVAQSGAATLAGLVDDLLDLARLEAGRMELQLRQVDVREAMERVHGLVHGQAMAKGLTLHIDIEDDVPPIAADMNRLAQVLLNLFANAIKFTNEGSIVGTVRPRDDGVEIVIADTGIGISPDALPRIFDEFRQEDSGTTRRFGGSGLGLAIVKRLVEMQEGTVSAESQVGSGSRFTVWFPGFVSKAAIPSAARGEEALVGG
jgi:signal transduction histidine kinase